jgi:hypothetical protein
VTATRKTPLSSTRFADAGIATVLTAVRIPRMNTMMERRVRTCRSELPDRMLIRNKTHLPRALRTFEDTTTITDRTGHCIRLRRCVPYPNRSPDKAG